MLSEKALNFLCSSLRGDCGAGRLDEAIPYLEQSVVMMAAGTAPAANRAWARTNLAVGLERAGRYAQAVEVVRSMLDDHREAGDAEGEAKATAWLLELEGCL